MEKMSPNQDFLDVLSSHLSANRINEAETLARQMIGQWPDHGLGWKIVGSLLAHGDRTEEALPFLEKAVLLLPSDHDAINTLAGALRELGRLSEAEVYCRRALHLDPHSYLAFNNLGNVFRDRVSLPEAETCYRRALQLSPNFHPAHNNLGAVLHSLDRMAEAEACYRRALELDGSYYLALANLGGVLREVGKLAEAEVACRRALQLSPDLYVAHNNLGNVLLDSGRLPEAEASYRLALARRPDDFLVQHNLGVTFYAAGRLAEAEACCRRSIALKSDFYLSCNTLGSILRDSGRLIEAERFYRLALELKPEYALATSNLATLKGYRSDFSEVKTLCDAAVGQLSSSGKDGRAIREGRLYILSYHPDLSVVDIFSEFVRWGDSQGCAPLPHRHANDATPRRKLRIGYVSPDFRRHTSRFYFEPLFANHDRGKFELFAYSNVQIRDDYTERFARLFDHWRDIAPISDDSAAELVRQDRIDILVDGCNHMRGERLGLFARKPAPVQASWLGSAWTSGLPTMDYVLLDPHIAPAGTLAREEIVRLPHTFFAYRPPDAAARIVEAPCVRNGFTTFGYYGRTERLNYRVFGLWGKILAASPNARLVLDFRPFADPETRQYYVDFLRAQGVDVSRVMLRYSKNVWHALNEVDIMLDSFPHSGGTMIMDSLWMGVPVLTMAARPPLGRIGATLMTNMGLESWVAESEQGYLEAALKFADEHKSLDALRRGMRTRLAASPLRDEVGFARAIEWAYLEMWRRWCAGAKACPIDVPKT